MAMRVSRIFLNANLSEHYKEQLKVSVASDRAHYIRNVLRGSVGDEIVVFDGTGGEYTGRLEEVSKKGVQLSLTEFVDVDRTPHVSINIGLCITKRDAMDMAIQKVTELGVREIHPLVSERVSVSKKQFNDRVDHWHNVAISACEQCGMNRVPLIREPTRLSDWCDSQTGTKLCGLPGNQRFRPDMVEDKKLSLLVGPEGGFSQDEQDAIISSGFVGIDLGTRILRAETAAISLTTLVTQNF